jgi:cardiolipin synthase
VRQLLAPPNLLTITRILMTPLIVTSLMQGACGRALALSSIAGATDAADGFLARRFGWKTQVGLYLDPVADKLLLTSLYLCFGFAGVVPGWLVALVVGRDILILLLVAGGLVLTRRREYPPSLWGKISTVVQISAAAVFLGRCAFPQDVPEGLAEFAVWCVAGATAWSGIHYSARAAAWVRRG